MRRSLLVIGLLLTTAPAFAASDSPDSTDTVPRPVVSEFAAVGTEQFRDFPGIVESEVQTVLAFQTSGQMATRPVDVGDTVAAGEVIATLDQTTLAEDVASAEAAVSSAQAQADFAQQTFERADELHQSNVVSDERLDAARADRDTAAASLQAAQADLASARDAESFSTLKAPSSGIVLEVHAEPGATVSAGLPIVTIAAGDQLEVTIDVPSELLPLLQQGTQFTIDRRITGSAPIGGTLRLIDPVVDAGARSHRAHIRIAADSGLRLGSLVAVSLDVESVPLISLPKVAIAADDTVWRIDPDRSLTKVPVTLGTEIGDRVVVSDGVSEGDEILVRGIHSVTEGQIVGERIAP